MEETKLSVVEINRLNSAVADIDEQSTGWLDRFDVCCDRAGMSRMSVIKLMGDQMAEGSLKIDRARIISCAPIKNESERESRILSQLLNLKVPKEKTRIHKKKIKRTIQ